MRENIIDKRGFQILTVKKQQNLKHSVSFHLLHKKELFISAAE